MIKILSVIALAVMCYLLSKQIALQYAPQDEFFFWGWISSILTGFLINWFTANIR